MNEWASLIGLQIVLQKFWAAYAYTCVLRRITVPLLAHNLAAFLFFINFRSTCNKKFTIPRFQLQSCLFSSTPSQRLDELQCGFANMKSSSEGTNKPHDMVLM